jgi:DNA polymerase/3'-5' exonuclease PolX
VQGQTVIKKQSTLFPEEPHKVIPELDLNEAEKLASSIRNAVEAQCTKIETVGSIRRQKAKIHDIDFVVIPKTDNEWQKINEDLRLLKAKPSCAGNNLIKAFVPCEKGLFQADFYRAEPINFGIQMLVRTGSAEHNIWLAGYAISKGMRIKYSQGLIKDERVIAGECEKDVFEALGLPFPEPKEREICDKKPLWESGPNEVH